MNTFTKTAAGAVLGGSLLVAGGFGLANAAPEAPAPQPEAPQPISGASLNVGLTVNGEQVGTIQNVSVNTAQTLASSVCPSDDLSAQLPQLANKEISTVPVCASATGVSYTFTQAGPGNSELAPGQTRGNAGIGATAVPTPAPAAPSAGSSTAEGR